MDVRGYLFLGFWALFMGGGCSSLPRSADALPVNSLFTEIPANVSQVDFENILTYTEEFNVYTYRNFYNGGGVGLGDINNDGLLDIFFCGNQVDNKLYLNKGNFLFEDITERAGVACKDVWSSGVSFADVNGDGLLDIYVCKSGKPGGNNRYNELFINNGDLTFTEKARDYGIADVGLSSHGAFFDYDRDGDLDLYLLNNSIRSVGGYDLIKDQRQIRDPEGGNKLYRHDGDHYTDVSEEAGIYGSAIGFGLGVTIGDVNRDGWQDIYVSNDYFERDYLYINQQDGTFSEQVESQMQELSLSSMGADMADVNNDGYPEIFVTDMLPEGDARMKTKTTFENWDKYQINLRNGYFRQFTRNVLQLNNTNNTFSEIGRMAGVYATDWSWGALITDLDNDGLKDIFVANGIYKDLTDQDYVNFIADPRTVREIIKQENAVIKRLVDSIPSTPLPNYAFHNNGDLTFTNRAEEWGLGTPSHSNGSVYGDLDNDGDLDLVVNNVNMPSFIYRNESDSLKPKNHYLAMSFTGEGMNPFALGTQVYIHHEGQVYYQELNPMRGFQSTVDHRLLFGLGSLQQVDSVWIRWPNGKSQLLTEVPTNQHLALSQAEADKEDWSPEASSTDQLFSEVSEDLSVPYRHIENDFVDFHRERLLFHMLSAEGPRICEGDVNGDGRQDIYVGGAKDSPGAMLIQGANGRFSPKNTALFEADKGAEDTDCVFFDADGDGDLDLFVCSGGNEFSASSSSLFNRLYLNDGRGNFEKNSTWTNSLKLQSTGCVAVADYDGDGDQDLFVGSRLRPMLYGVPVDGYLYENDGSGSFTDVTQQKAPGLLQAGLITDAVWLDQDNDGDLDLALAGEWMPIRFFENVADESGTGQQFRERKDGTGLENSHGFWNRLEAADLDGDGDTDLIGGNHGINSRFKGSKKQPVCMYVNDFDGNRAAEQIICIYNGDRAYPLVLRQDLVMQLPHLKKKYLRFSNYREQTIEDIFTPQELERAIKLEAYELRSAIMLNGGDGSFSLNPLPQLAQVAPIYAIQAGDFDEDGKVDLLVAGNMLRAKPEVGTYGASYGNFLKGDGAGNFEAISPAQSGFSTRGEVRDMVLLPMGGKPYVFLARNNQGIQVFQYKTP